MEDAYAQALWKIVSGGTDAKKAVRALHETLVVHGRESLLPRIARAFARLAEKNISRHEVVLTVSRAKDAVIAQKQAKALLKENKVAVKDLKTQVDDTLIGGWRLEGKETLFDNSYKKHLLSMYNRVVEK